jgi:hypothetical protein
VTSRGCGEYGIAVSGKLLRHVHVYSKDKDNNELPKFSFISAGSKHAIALDFSAKPGWSEAVQERFDRQVHTSSLAY